MEEASEEVSEKDLEVLFEILIVATAIDFFVFFFSLLVDSIRISLIATDCFKELVSSKARRKPRRKILIISKVLMFEGRRGRRICYKMAKKIRFISIRISSGIDSDRIVGVDILFN